MAGGGISGGAMRAIYKAAGAAAGVTMRMRSLRASDEDEKLYRERRGVWEGHQQEGGGAWLWIHAASVGEAEIAIALARALGAKLPGVRLVISSMTVTGQARVEREEGIESRFFPVDYARYVKRILGSSPPLLFVSVETEIWPETLRLLAARGVPAAVANARLSETSLPRYRKFAAMIEPRIAALAKVCARDDEAASRWLTLGASKDAVEVTGNIKFDLASPRKDGTIESLFERVPQPAAGTIVVREQYEPLLLAASTHESEEAFALEAFAAVRARSADARLLLAPRHPERTEAVLALVRERGMRVSRWGQLRAATLPALWPPELDVIVIDRFGLLRAAYAAADAAFVGGSTIEGPGGHNLLEPVTALCPVSAGRYLDNIADQVDLLAESNALRIVKNVDDLARFWMEVIARPREFGVRTRSASGSIRDRCGALDRTVAALLPLVEQTQKRP